jgi:hypothetical protein
MDMKKAKYLVIGGFVLMVIAALLAFGTGSVNAQATEPPPGWAESGHADKEAEAFRHWDEEEGKIVPGSCSKCHTATGLPLILNEKVIIYPNPPGANKASQSLNQPAGDGLACATCHDENGANYFVSSVMFPSGKSANFSSASANICLNCHQGRESTASVDASIARATDANGKPVTDNKVARDKDGKPTLSFRNPHYFAAGASFFGDYVQGMYQFKNQKYNGLSAHPEPMNNCIACHAVNKDSHSLEVQYEKCATCHGDVKTVEDLAKIRVKEDTKDYDGDKDKAEGYGQELTGMAEKLFLAMQAYATKNATADKAGTTFGIVYDGATYPYYFNDLNGNGTLDTDEAKADNAFNAWTPNLLRAAYNYQWWQKDPGLFAHNFYYGAQTLFDSIKAVNGSTSGMTRPAVPNKPAPMPDKPVPPES